MRPLSTPAATDATAQLVPRAAARRLRDRHGRGQPARGHVPRRLAHRAAGEGLLCLVTPYPTRALRQRPHAPSAHSLPLPPRGPTALLSRRRSGPEEALESFKSSVRHAYVVDSRMTRPSPPRICSSARGRPRARSACRIRFRHCSLGNIRRRWKRSLRRRRRRFARSGSTDQRINMAAAAVPPDPSPLARVRRDGLSGCLRRRRRRAGPAR